MDPKERALLLEATATGPLLETFQWVSSGETPELFIPASTMSKDERGAFHRALREADLSVDSKTDGDAIRVWRTKPGGNRGRWDPTKPEYLRFVVEKEHLTTLDAIDELSCRLNCKHERFAYAGAKDKVRHLHFQLCPRHGVWAFLCVIFSFFVVRLPSRHNT